MGNEENSNNRNSQENMSFERHFDEDIKNEDLEEEYKDTIIPLPGMEIVEEVHDVRHGEYLEIRHLTVQ